MNFIVAKSRPSKQITIAKETSCWFPKDQNLAPPKFLAKTNLSENNQKRSLEREKQKQSEKKGPTKKKKKKNPYKHTRQLDAD